VTRATVVATLLLAAALTVWAPGVSLSSGPLSAAHHKLGCLACHVPLEGVPEERCVGCHPVGTIAGNDGGVPEGGVAREAIALLHQSAPRCLGCHPAHEGRKRAAFSHQTLTPEGLRACEACHARPDTGVHVNAIACERCHQTEAFRPARFRHQAASDPPCATCHEAQRPTDAVHSAGGDCGACHGSTGWRGASFEHARIFALVGAHRLPCSSCHLEAWRFKSYVCTNCHEHSPERLAHEHAEEGITDLRDCVRCHRGGEHGSRGN
jgi:hypothetical protein